MRAFVLRSLRQVDRLVALLRDTWGAQAASGRALEVLVAENGGRPTPRQLGFYFRRVLQPISEQAVVHGQRFSVATWHEHYKRRFVGFEEDASGAVLGLSVTTLTVAEFSDYLQKVQADAALEHGVVFDEE